MNDHGSVLISFAVGTSFEKVKRTNKRVRRITNKAPKPPIAPTPDLQGIILSREETEKFNEQERKKQRLNNNDNDKTVNLTFWELVFQADRTGFFDESQLLPPPSQEEEEIPLPPPPPPPSKPKVLPSLEAKNEEKIARHLQKFFNNKDKKRSKYILNPCSDSEEYSDFQSSDYENSKAYYTQSSSSSSSSDNDEEEEGEVNDFVVQLVDDDNEPSRDESSQVVLDDEENVEAQLFALTLSDALDDNFPLKDGVTQATDLPFGFVSTPAPTIVEHETHPLYNAHAQFPNPPMGFTRKNLFDTQDVSYDNPKFWVGFVSLALSNALVIQCSRCKSNVRCGSCIYTMYTNNTHTCKKCLGQNTSSRDITLDARGYASFVPEDEVMQCSSINDTSPFHTRPFQGEFSDDVLNLNVIPCGVKRRLFGCQGCNLISCERHYLKLLRIALTRIANHDTLLLNPDQPLAEPFNDSFLHKLSYFFNCNFFENASNSLSTRAAAYNESIKERIF